MNKIYISQIDIQYEPSINLGVFSTLEKAKERIKLYVEEVPYTEHIGIYCVYEMKMDDLETDPFGHKPCWVHPDY
jgi:hypothetical protein